MRVGIDFGTTHTVAAVVDRGNYPVVSFDGLDTWPSLIAANDAGDLRFGLDAAAARLIAEAETSVQIATAVNTFKLFITTSPFSVHRCPSGN